MKKIKYLLFLFFLFSFANVKALALDQTKYAMRLDTGYILLWPLVLIYEFISYIIQKRTS